MSVNNVVNGELEQVAGEASVENSYESTSITRALSASMTNSIKRGLSGAVGGDMFDPTKSYTGGDMFIYGNKVYRVKDGQGIHGGVIPSAVEEISLKSLNQTIASNLVRGTLSITTTHKVNKSEYQKCGNVIIYNFEIEATSAINGWTTMATLPISSAISNYCIGYLNGALGMIYIAQNGQMQLGAPLASGKQVYGTITILL